MHPLFQCLSVLLETIPNHFQTMINLHLSLWMNLCSFPTNFDNWLSPILFNFVRIFVCLYVTPFVLNYNSKPYSVFGKIPKQSLVMGLFVATPIIPIATRNWNKIKKLTKFVNVVSTIIVLASIPWTVRLLTYFWKSLNVHRRPCTFLVSLQEVVKICTGI